MQLRASNGVVPVGRAVLGCGSEWCAGALSFVYCAECIWQSASAVANGLCADLSIQLSARSAVLPLGQAGLSCIVQCAVGTPLSTLVLACTWVQGVMCCQWGVQGCTVVGYTILNGLQPLMPPVYYSGMWNRLLDHSLMLAVQLATQRFLDSHAYQISNPQ